MGGQGGPRRGPTGIGCSCEGGKEMGVSGGAGGVVRDQRSNSR